MSQQKEKPRRLVAMQNPRMDDRAAKARAAKRKGKELTRPQGRKPREMKKSVAYIIILVLSFASAYLSACFRV